jgi:hypothetical protein
MSKGSYNLSKTYLLPLMSELIDIEPMFIENLENTYIFDENDEHQECFYILQKFSFKNPEFTAYEHRLTSSSLFVKHVDLGSKVLYIFKFPEEYLPEYYAIQRGEYSKFGDDAKELIIKFWKKIYYTNPEAKPVIHKMFQILSKSPKLKLEMENELSTPKGIVTIGDGELGEMLVKSNETFHKQVFVDTW